MRKILFILIIIFSSLSYTQEKIGIVGGLNATQVTDGFFKGLDTFGIGLHIGAVYNFEIKKNILFSPKILYSQQGDRLESGATFFNGKWRSGGSSNLLDYKLSYINIPLNFKFFKKTYIVLGPQIGILLSTEKLKLDFGEIENKIDFGINFGIGKKINDFFIELNVTQGFSRLITHERTQTGIFDFDSFKGNNLVAQLSLGYYFK